MANDDLRWLFKPLVWEPDPRQKGVSAVTTELGRFESHGEGPVCWWVEPDHCLISAETGEAARIEVQRRHEELALSLLDLDALRANLALSSYRPT